MLECEEERRRKLVLMQYIQVSLPGKWIIFTLEVNSNSFHKSSLVISRAYITKRLQSIRTRTSRHKSSFLPTAVSLLNSAPTHLSWLQVPHLPSTLSSRSFAQLMLLHIHRSVLYITFYFLVIYLVFILFCIHFKFVYKTTFLSLLLFCFFCFILLAFAPDTMTNSLDCKMFFTVPGNKAFLIPILMFLMPFAQWIKK